MAGVIKNDNNMPWVRLITKWSIIYPDSIPDIYNFTMQMIREMTV
jgi:hypothetical protein